MRINGIRILTLDVPNYTGNGPGRVANMTAFGAAAALPRSTRELPRAHVVIGSSVHPLAAAAGARHARRLRVPFVFEVRDLWPETFIRLGKLASTSVTAKALYSLEEKLWTQAHMVLSPLGQVPGYERERGLPHRPFLHVPNGVDTHLFDPSSTPHEGPLQLGYFGSHGNTDYLETIVQALAEPSVAARAGDISVHFFGWGPGKLALQDMADKLRLANLEFHQPLDRDRLPAAMRKMDGFLFPLGDSKGLYSFGASPNKLQDYMAAGRPILMNAPFLGDPVTLSAGGGILVPDCTPESWAAALHKFADTTEEQRVDMGSRLRELAEEKYEFSVLAGHLDRGLRSLIGPTS